MRHTFLRLAEKFKKKMLEFLEETSLFHLSERKEVKVEKYESPSFTEEEVRYIFSLYWEEIKARMEEYVNLPYKVGDIVIPNYFDPNKYSQNPWDTGVEWLIRDFNKNKITELKVLSIRISSDYVKYLLDEFINNERHLKCTETQLKRRFNNYVRDSSNSSKVMTEFNGLFFSIGVQDPDLNSKYELNNYCFLEKDSIISQLTKELWEVKSLIEIKRTSLKESELHLEGMIEKLSIYPSLTSNLIS